jgi:hypothetical protein
MLKLIGEYTRESLAIRVGRRLNSHDVVDTLTEAMLKHGVPEHIRSDNRPEFVVRRMRKWLAGLGTKPLYIEPGSPDAAFAKPEICEALEERKVKYTIRLPANDNLERKVAQLLKRPVGRPSYKPVVRYRSFFYQAACWNRARRV